MNKKSVIGIAIGIVVATALMGYFVYATSNDKPWYGLSCAEMIELAMSPEHHSFTEQQHMQFHKDLEPCLQNMENHEG